MDRSAHADSRSVVAAHSVMARRVIPLIFILVGVWIVFYPFMKQLDQGSLSGDSAAYFAWLQSAVEDGDLQFGDDIRELDPHADANLLRPTITGHTTNAFPPGTAILWSPFYFAGKALEPFFGIADRTAELRWLTLWIAIATGVLTAFTPPLIYLILRRWFTPGTALLASLCAFLLTPLLYYGMVSKTNSHAPSAFAAALFLWLAFRARERETIIPWLLAGLAAGLVFLCRWMDIIIILWPLALELPEFWNALRGKTKLRPLLLRYFAFTAPLALILALQIGLNWVIFGVGKSPFDYGANVVLWGLPAWLDVMFSLRHGLFSWHPAHYLAVAGIALAAFRRSPAAIGAAAVFLLTLYLSAVTGDWWAGASFGMRRFVSIAPVFAFGFAACTELFKSRIWKISFLFIALLLFGWNYEMVKNAIFWKLDIDLSPQLANPLNRAGGPPTDTYGYPLMAPTHLLRMMQLPGVPAQEAEWINDYYLIGMQLNLGGSVSAATPAFQGSFSPLRPGDLEKTRRLDGPGTVYFRLRSVQYPLRMTVHGSLAAIASRGRDVPLLEIRVNGRSAYSFLVESRDADLAIFMLPAAALQAGINRIDLQLFAFPDTRKARRQIGHAPLQTLPSVRPAYRRWLLSISSIEFRRAPHDRAQPASGKTKRSRR